MQPAIKTQRKKDKLLNDGRLHTDVNDNILKTTGVHICNISPARIETQRIVTGIKRQAVDTMEGPSTIRAQVFQNVPTPVLSTVPSKHATLKIIKRARNEVHAPPAAPVDKAAYTRMFELLQQCWPTFAPRSASIDFEQAMVGALRAKHPQCKINFCLFHLVRNMKKRISEQGLMQLYTKDVAFSLSARMIKSLAFILLQDLTPPLAALENYLPDQFQPVLDWFVDNYVGQLRNNGTRRQPLFELEEWSVHLRTLEGADRTNNFCEAFHRRLQHSFACTNPSIWHFIDTIRKEQKIVDVRSVHRGDDEQQQQMQEISICADVWLEVFALISPHELGQLMALISDRFDALVDEHFKTRKWSLRGMEISAIDGNGAKIVNFSRRLRDRQLPIAPGSPPNKVIGFEGIEIRYIDGRVIDFSNAFADFSKAV
uniref:MULE transposase domain-containing protein n=1 Tax=Globodera rostochiensis TaxID=31243 RepID=A0A914GTC2_GLORO